MQILFEKQHRKKKPYCEVKKIKLKIYVIRMLGKISKKY